MSVMDEIKADAVKLHAAFGELIDKLHGADPVTAADPSTVSAEPVAAAAEPAAAESADTAAAPESQEADATVSDAEPAVDTAAVDPTV